MIKGVVAAAPPNSAKRIGHDSSLDHAAINNPTGNPVRHAFVREEKGLRGGGFGILLASQLVDDLVYNERHNEVLFVKYLS